MSIFNYRSAIKIIFDRPIITDPLVIIGTEYYKPIFESGFSIIKSGENASYPATRAFDGDESTYWRSVSSPSSPQWVGTNFGTQITLTKINVRMDYSSGRINAYEIQGSNDGTNYTTITGGNFLNVSGFQEVLFSSSTYQYWRVYATSKYSSYYSINEIIFYNTRNIYATDGWAISAYEPLTSPGGPIILTNYKVLKITKSEDNMSIVVWIDPRNTIRYPQGSINILFTGQLFGSGNVSVVPFSINFVPSNIVPVFRPHDPENISIAPLATLICFEVIYKYSKNGDEYLTASGYAATIVITNVGGVPL